VKIDRKRYCQVHLDEWRRKLAVEDWFGYIDRPDRLMRVLERAKPFQISTAREIEAKDEFVYWEEVNDLVSDWYGLWPNATEQEIEVAAAVEKLHEDWWRSGGFCDQHLEITKQLKDQYHDLVHGYAEFISKESVSNTSK